MKSIDQAILKYLNENNANELDTFIISPSQILDSMLLPKGHKIIYESIIILDSLNSFNNGLSNEEMDLELLEIDDSSPLYSWRCGVLAIKEFYNGNQLKVIDYLNEVRNNSPVKKLNSYILKSKETALFIHDENLNSSVDALKEVIENSLTDLYPTTVRLLLDDLKDNNNENLKNSILTIIEESIDFIPLDIIHNSIIHHISVTESTRLMALGTMYKQPIKSLEYLFSYIHLAEFKDTESENLIALISIIQEVVKVLIKEKYEFESNEEKKVFIKNSNLFIQLLDSFFKMDYLKSSNPLTNLKRALNINIDNALNVNIGLKNIQKELF